MYSTYKSKYYCKYCNQSYASKQYIKKHITSKKCVERYFNLYNLGLKKNMTEHPFFQDYLIEKIFLNLNKKLCISC